MPVPSESASPESLAARVVELEAENARLRAEAAVKDTQIERLLVAVELLQARVAELEAQARKNSANSSKPPSSDGPAKPAPKSLRGRSKRRPGGQKGHPGAALVQVAGPAVRVRHEPVCCRSCRASLEEAAEVGVERRQVFDLPAIAPEVTEHVLVKRRCGCGATTRAQAPPGVSAPAQYGPALAAVATYLYAGQFLSADRTATAMGELFQAPLSSGTVTAMAARAASSIEGGGFLRRVTDRIAAAPLAHFDETGLRVQGATRWVHSASTEDFVLLTVHPKRGVEGMDAAGVLPRFTGIAVHDGWAPYDTYNAATHARCNAHLLRELQAVIDHHTATRPAGSWCWARQARTALLEMKALVQTALAADGTLDGLDHRELAGWMHAWRSASRLGAQATAARRDNLEKDHNALARRLIDRQDDHLRFTTDPRVPFTNNPAEQTIRMIKIRQKVSGCLRTLTGARLFCTIRSYTATATRHGIALLDALTQAAHGHPWLPPAAA